MIDRCLLASLVATLATGSVAQTTWRRAYGALDNEEARVVRVVDGDRFAIAGSTGSFGAGASDIYVLMVDGAGDPVWSRTIGGPGVEVASDMLVLADEGLLLVGTTTSMGAGGYDGYLVRTDADGAVLWQRSYGGADWDFLHDIRSDGAGGFLLTGQTFSFGPNGGNAWILRVNDQGDELWSDIPQILAPSAGYAATPTADGGLALVGTASVGEAPEDVVVVKYDPDDEQEWALLFGGDSTDVGRDIVQTIDGGFSIMGSTRSYSQWVEAYHLKINASGGEDWYRNWGQINDQEALEHVELPTGEFMSIGYTRTSGGGGKDMFLLKSATDGGFVYGRTFGGSEDETGYGLVVLPDGFLCAGVTSTYGSGGTDVFIVRTGIDGTTEFETVEDAFDPLSVAEAAYATLPIHPNPSSGIINIPPRSSAGRWTLADVRGRVWIDGAFAPGTTRLETDVPSGIYLLRLIGNDGTAASTRVTILRP